MAIIMNRGEFKGSSLDNITGKERSGKDVPSWFMNKEYNKIVEYIAMEAREFIKFNVWLHKRLPILHDEFKAELAEYYEKENT